MALTMRRPAGQRKVRSPLRRDPFTVTRAGEKKVQKSAPTESVIVTTVPVTWVSACSSHEAFEMVLEELGSVYAAVDMRPEDEILRILSERTRPD